MKTLFVFLISTILIFSCKAKSKFPGLEDLVRTDTTINDVKEEKQNLSHQQPIVRKWRITDALPAPSQSERDEFINSIMEFTKEEKLFITSKGKTEEVASINFSFDNKYLLSQGTDHDELDTLLIQELTLSRLVLVSIKDNKTLIAEAVK